MKRLEKMIAVLLIGSVANTAHAADPDTARARLDAPQASTDDKTIEKSVAAFKEIIGDATKKIPTTVLQKAKCVAVFPNVITAALLAGGTHGNGVALCKSGGGDWGGPVFLDLTGGSFGLQAGGKSSEIVLFMLDDAARAAVKKGRFTLGADLNVVAGSYEQGYIAPASSVVAYAKTSGAFAGAALSGVNVSPDETKNKSFYGKEMSLTQIVDGTLPPEAVAPVKELRDLMPKY